MSVSAADQTKNMDLKMYHLKKAVPNIFYRLFRFAFILCMAYVLLSPLLIMLARAVRPSADMTNPSIVWIPSGFTLVNFKQAIDVLKYWNTLLYTSRIVILSTIFTLISCSMAGYALARYHLKISKLCVAVAILTIIVPLQTYIIPLYFQFRFLNITDTELSFYLPALLASGLRSGLFVVVFMQFFKGLPKELEDAARIDGCSEKRTFAQVMIPNAGPVYLVVSLFSIVWYWNDYYFSQIMMRNRMMLSTKISVLKRLVSLNTALASNGDEFAQTVIVFAGAFLFILPPLILYIFAQRFFIQSIERTGIVG